MAHFTAFPVTASEAAEAGTIVGESVLQGNTTPEQAGDQWLRWADESHSAGVAFLDAYDATGAPR